uniref:Uncharacterized protein n=1 Tax=Anguilla anguilla TaxID=7936 RepID=A0A0E9WIG9_ANGAN
MLFVKAVQTRFIPIPFSWLGGVVICNLKMFPLHFKLNILIRDCGLPNPMGNLNGLCGRIKSG